MKTESIFAKKSAVPVWALLCTLLWGSASPCIKLGYSLFQVGSGDSMSQILFAGVRFTLAGILTVLFASLGQKRVIVPKKSSWGMVIALAMCQTVIQYVLFYVGLAHAPGYKGAMISGMCSFFAILISGLIFKTEKVTALKLVGCAVGFVGIFLINFNHQTFSFSMSPAGEGALMLSTISYAFSSVLIKKFSSREDPVTLSGWQFFAGGLFMVVMALVSGGRLDAVSGSAWALMLYMGALSAVAYSIWGKLLEYHPVSEVTVFSFGTPVFGTLLSIIILGEGAQIGVLQCIAALVCICLGIYIVNRQSPD